MTMTQTSVVEGLLHKRHKDLREALGTAYRREMAATRTVARREGCPVVRSDGINVNAMGDDGHAGRSWSWDGTRKGLLAIIEDFARDPRVDLVFIDHFFTAYASISDDCDGWPNAGGFSLNVWSRPGTEPASAEPEYTNVKPKPVKRDCTACGGEGYGTEPGDCPVCQGSGQDRTGTL